MKRITLTQFQNHGSKYEVILGNGTKHAFPSERKAIAFLKEISDQMTTIWYRLREKTLLLDDAYHRAWPYYWHDGGGKKVHNYTRELRLKESLRSCHDLIDDLGSVGRCSSGPYMVFINAFKICEYQIGALVVLRDDASRRKDAAEVIRLNDVMDSIHVSVAQMRRMGSMTQTGFADAPFTIMLEGRESA